MSLKYQIAPAIAATNPPPIPKAQAWARQYLASPAGSSQRLLNLSQGVPRNPPHPAFSSALSHISAEPDTSKYGSILGETSLRKAFASEINRMYRVPGHAESQAQNGAAEGSAPNGVGEEGVGHKESLPTLSTEEVRHSGAGVTEHDIAITTGCNMAFLSLVVALCPPGSAALLPVPTYFNMDMSLSLKSVKSLYIPCSPSDNFRPDIDAARRYLQKAEREIRMIVLVTPSNPTGAVYSHADLKAWYDLAREYGVALVLDETYREFVEDEEEGMMGVPHRLFEEEDWRETLISIGSFSSYRIPGHRLGSVIASPKLLDHLTTVCDCMQICAPRPPQLALARTLPDLRDDLVASSRTLANRHKLFTQTVESVPGWSIASQGGYYAYVAFPADYQTASSSLGVKRKQLSSEDIARELTLRCGVVVLPGGFFMPGQTDAAWDEIEGGEPLRHDRWLRFAIANVEDQDVVELEGRLRQMNKIMGLEE